MNQKNTFGEGTLYVLTNYIYAFLMTNIYFVLSNLIFLFFVIILKPSFSNITIYFLALIPTGPSISALFYSIGKLIREKELSPLHDFCHGYKINFKDTIKFWTPLLIIFYVLVVDLQYFHTNSSLENHILAILFLIGIGVMSVVLLNAFLINAGFSFRTKDIWKLSVYYMFVKLKITLGNIGIMIIALFIASITSSFMIILISSVICYAVMLNSRPLLEDIKVNFCEVS